MSEKILVCVAWPYANGFAHVGHIAGSYLPADIFARYHRAKGNEVLMVSGSDEHGTPVTIKAEQENKTPAQVADYNHRAFVDTWRRLGISFDWYTSTETANHARVTQDVFLNLYEKGYLYKDGEYTELLAPGWRMGWAKAINNNSAVVGHGCDYQKCSDFIYQDGEYTSLPLRDWHPCDQPSRHEAAKSSAGCPPLLANHQGRGFQFTVNQDTPG